MDRMRSRVNGAGSMPARANRARAAVSAGVAVLLLTATACGGGGGGDKGSEGETGGAPPVSIPGKTNNHGTATAKNGMEVELDDFYFGPSFVKAKANEQVSIELKNEGKATHSFTSPEMHVDEELSPGSTKTVTVSAPASGYVQFFCRFHQAQGMQGAVFVS